MAHISPQYHYMHIHKPASPKYVYLTPKHRTSINIHFQVHNSIMYKLIEGCIVLQQVQRNYAVYLQLQLKWVTQILVQIMDIPSIIGAQRTLAATQTCYNCSELLTTTMVVTPYDTKKSNIPIRSINFCHKLLSLQAHLINQLIFK